MSIVEKSAPPSRANNEHGAELGTRIREIVRAYRIDTWAAYSLNQLTKRGAGIYVQQHGIFTRHSRRAWAYVVGNCPEVEVRRFIVAENLYEEEGVEETSHINKLVKMGIACGLTSEEIYGAAALPSTRAALLIWETLTKDRPWLVGAAAKGCLELETTAGIEGKRWMDRLGLSADDVDFWLLHHEADKVHGAGSIDLVLKYLPRAGDVTENDIIQAVEDSMFAFKTFREGIAQAAEQAG
jgi:pyrroloquinoline quinone (PQQ) biosynthesis protein C